MIQQHSRLHYYSLKPFIAEETLKNEYNVMIGRNFSGYTRINRHENSVTTLVPSSTLKSPTPGSLSYRTLLTMLSTIRRALTPNANQAEDRDLMNVSLENSLAAPNPLTRDSSPPPFSPIESSPHESLPWATQTSNHNDPVIAEQHDLPMDLSSDRDSPDREQEATDDSLLGPVRASDSATKPHFGNFSVDGASEDHHLKPEDDTQLGGPPLPSTEPAESTSQPQRAPTPSANPAGPDPETSSIPQPSNTVIKAKGKAPRPQKAERVASQSGTASVEPEQSASAAADEAKMFTSPKARPSKRKRDEDPSETKTKYVKKPRGQPKKEEGYTATSKQPDATEQELPKERGRPKKEVGSSATAKQEATTKDESPKKRGRPKKEEVSTQKGKPQRASGEDAPAKRGRPKKEDAPSTATQRDLVQQDTRAKEMPKKQGRPEKEAEPAGAAKPTGAPAVDAPKKRGRPKKNAEAAQATEPQVASTRKTGKPKNNEDVVEATVPKGTIQAETPKKRGRPKATEQADAPKLETPMKRGRPKKEQATPKGAKPTGIVKKKAGRK